VNHKAMWSVGVAVVLAMAAGAPARADWLVTKEGGRLEIKGTYKTKGRVLIFTLPNGTLSSMRLEEVDLEASRIATEEAVAAAQREAAAAAVEEADKPRKKSIISLTDKDFKKTAPPAADSDADGDGKGDDKKDATPAPSTGSTQVQVVNWERVPQEKVKTDGLEVTGTVRNTSNEKVTDVQVMANLYDEVGTLVGKVSAQLADPALDPGESSGFTVSAPGLFSFSAVRFDIQA
jgi:hypothetical protein